MSEDDDADLTLRSHLNSHKVRRSVMRDTAWIDHDDPLTIVLVHGFRTDEQSASKNYATFRANLRQISEHLFSCTKTFTWPSQGRLIRLHRYFADRDIAAQEVGRKLAEFIRDDIRRVTRPRKYVFVAHSLGSRVVLEMVYHLDQMEVDYSTRIRIFLMAAAVRIEDFERHGQDRYRDVVAKLQASNVLYSPDDGVLRIAFVLGMRPYSKEAIGRYGIPRDAWSERPQQMYGYGHTDYWADKNQEATRALAVFLGYAVTARLPGTLVASGYPLSGDVLT